MLKEFFFKPIGTLGFILTFNGFLFTLIGLIISPQNYLFSGLSLVTFGAGVVCVSIRAVEIKQRENLLTFGKVTSGTITYLTQNKIARVNREYPWLIQYQYQVNNDSLQGSDLIMDLPKDYIVGKSIEVIYNPTNPTINRIRSN